MAITNTLLYRQDFTGTTVTVTHNLDLRDIDYRVVCSGESRADLVQNMNFTDGDERNSFVIDLKSYNIGYIQILGGDIYPTNLPSPESNVKLVDVLENEFLLDVYQSGSTTQLNNSTYTSIDWDAQAIVGSNYTHSVGGTNVRINSSGTYQITYSISSDYNANTNQRRVVRSRLALDGTEIPRSGGYSYHRRTVESEGTITKTIITSLSVDNIITLDAIIYHPTSGTITNVSTIAEDSNITITKLNNG